MSKLQTSKASANIGIAEKLRVFHNPTTTLNIHFGRNSKYRLKIEKVNVVTYLISSDGNGDKRASRDQRGAT
jgi:hypothetical protein